MGNALVILRLAIGLVPTLLATIKTLEAEINVAGKGQIKGEALRLIVAEAFKVIPPEGQSGITPDNLARFVGATANILVGLFKKTGIWK